jgi:hypothetical protein
MRPGGKPEQSWGGGEAERRAGKPEQAFWPLPRGTPIWLCCQFSQATLRRRSQNQHCASPGEHEQALGVLFLQPFSQSSQMTSQSLSSTSASPVLALGNETPVSGQNRGITSPDEQACQRTRPDADRTEPSHRRPGHVRRLTEITAVCLVVTATRSVKPPTGCGPVYPLVSRPPGGVRETGRARPGSG